LGRGESSKDLVASSRALCGTRRWHAGRVLLLDFNIIVSFGGFFAAQSKQRRVRTCKWINHDLEIVVGCLLAF